uniref:Uncharacterized protein n=1 Tax=Arundo donax TaxID=35708 RepID=A0A0A9EUQ9_ARUDO
MIQTDGKNTISLRNIIQASGCPGDIHRVTHK